MSISNSLIYLDQLNTYPPYALALVVIGVCFLIYGVKLLSQAKEDKSGADKSPEISEGDSDDYDDYSDETWDDTSTIVIKTPGEDDSSSYTASNKFANIREEWMGKLSSYAPFLKTKGNNNGTDEKTEDDAEMVKNKKWQIWNWNK